jgi:hypothetical protein
MQHSVLIEDYMRLVETVNNPLTNVVTSVTIDTMEEKRVAHSIKVKLSVLHKGRIAAVTANKTLGQWLEEAIQEKIQREGRKVT